MLKEFIENIFNNYQLAKKGKFVDHPLVNLINNEFPNYLEDLTSTLGNYKIIGNAGKGKWTNCPRIFILNPKVTDLVGFGYFVIYIFSSDTKRLYLSLNQGIPNQNSISQQDHLENLRLKASNYRKILGEIPEEFDIKELSLGDPSFFRKFQIANVCAKSYSLDNLPSEEVLQSDLKFILSLYSKLFNKIPNIWQITPGSVSKGEQRTLWPLFRDNGFIGIGWLRNSSSYLDFDNIDELKEALINFYPNYKETDPSQAAKMVWDFTHNVKKGDIVVANAGFRKTRGIGIVTSDYIDPNNPENPGIFDYFWHLRKVDWIITDEMEFSQNVFYRSTIGKINDDKWVTIKNVYIQEHPQYTLLFKIIEGFETTNLNIHDFLSSILGRYLGVRKRDEKVGGHPLSAIFNEFTWELKSFANSTELSDNAKEYNSKSVHFGQNKFVSGPYVYVYNKMIEDFYIGYMFREDMQGAYLALNVSGTTINQEFEKNKDEFFSNDNFKKSYIAKLRNKIKNQVSSTEKFGNTSEGAWFNDKTIYAKYYEKNSLPPNEQLIADLNDIFTFYHVLTHVYGEITVLSDENEIQKAQDLFKDRFLEAADETIEAPTQSRRLPLSWSRKLNIWGYFGDVDNHYFNPFGIGKPDISSDNKTICEINSPHDGIKRNISGVFAKNSSGNLFLLHRGIFYGGKLSKENYSGDWIKINDGDKISEAILIGGLNDSDFPEKLRDFIKKIGGSRVQITFFEFLENRGYLFDYKLVENFLLSLKVKPFVILTGNSGTGKTKVAQLFSEYLEENNRFDSIDSELVAMFKTKKEASAVLPIIESSVAHYPNDQVRELLPQLIEKGLLNGNDLKRHEIVPVGANWTENRHVVGFYNVITEKYQKTQALDLILRAEEEFKDFKEHSQPYFLILDEMNLSHVERYFSDFLSVMESEEPLSLHENHDDEVEQDITLSDNILVIGTVNVDETTYMFSPKVLDRANTIEFLTHKPLGYMKNQFKTQKPSGDVDYLQDPLSDIDLVKEDNIRNFSINKLRNLMIHIQTERNTNFWDEISIEVDRIYEELKKAGFDFGFRVINEIMRFMYVSWKYEGQPETWENWERYFDAQIKQKMLPKLHGSQRTLQGVIKVLFEICYGKEMDKDPRLVLDGDIYSAKYPTAALKLKEMDKVLYEQRYVAFIN
ncbi:MrcB family domain-containing protein [Methanobacterium formicicum]|uniref:MrcB family domain-containing protein n=1 Tax=Methanobacterium formicicum TaxID=2162 RepID=UPI0024127099|nr:DUF3578 domain-containing protein [Methanobacterium formicicum]MDG3547272.1 DUF3578 domain-containing protein [Methanobacterium formicicum]